MPQRLKGQCCSAYVRQTSSSARLELVQYKRPACYAVTMRCCPIRFIMSALENADLETPSPSVSRSFSSRFTVIDSSDILGALGLEKVSGALVLLQNIAGGLGSHRVYFLLASVNIGVDHLKVSELTLH